MPYIILTIDDGIVFKVVHNDIKTKGRLKLISFNPLYEPYDIDAKQDKGSMEVCPLYCQCNAGTEYPKR
jgi:hypothetical protein